MSSKMKPIPSLPVSLPRWAIRALIGGRKTQLRVAYPARPIVPGHRVWVREELAERGLSLTYRAAMPIPYASSAPLGGPWLPAGRMPRWASRLTLEITGVRVHRLHQITDDDARAEGATSRPACGGYHGEEVGWAMDWSPVGTYSRTMERNLTPGDISLGSPRYAFLSKWREDHQRGALALEDDPVLVALTFVVQHRNIDELRKPETKR